MRKVPLTGGPSCGTTAPSERGKNSYQEPYSARSRSTSNGIGRAADTSSRNGCRSRASSAAGSKAAAKRSSTSSESSPSARAARRTASRPGPLGTRRAARANSSAPSSRTRPTSMRAGILMRACRRQVATGSLHASTVYVHSPVRSGVTRAPHRSVPGASSRIGVHRPGRPSGSRSTTFAPTASWPSRNTVAVTSKVSPTTAFAGRLPHSTAGRTSRTGMRPMAWGRFMVLPS